MRTIFWRFAYDDGALENILASDKLIFPDLLHWPLAKNNKQEKVISDLREGHYILLANFNMNTEIGTAKGVGNIVGFDNGRPIMSWKKPIPSWSLPPNPQGGVKEWRNEGVFCFDDEPAKRYKLSALTTKLFK